MNLELILWFVAWFVISEIVFINWYSRVCKRKSPTITQFKQGEWGQVKVMSLSLVGALTGFHYAIIIFPPVPDGNVIGYIFLLYEAIFLGVLALIFFINKSIAKRIEK